MNDKVKITFDDEYYNEIETIMIDAISIDVRKRLTYDEKLQFAGEYARAAIVIDDGNEIAYQVYELNAVEYFLFLKYYTNIDTEDFEFEYGKAYEFFVRHKKVFNDICGSDFQDTLFMGMKYLQNTISFYEKTHSLEYKVKHFLGSILNEDILKIVSESKLLNEELIDLLHKPKRDNNVVPMFESFAKK